MYIFDVQKFIKSSFEDGDTPNFIRENVFSWAMKIDGKPVDMTKELIGFCNGFTNNSHHGIGFFFISIVHRFNNFNKCPCSFNFHNLHRLISFTCQYINNITLICNFIEVFL